ncbi:MAG: hypothetical protein RIG77_18175 [Cyclobacteriaceae bacterium]
MVKKIFSFAISFLALHYSIVFLMPPNWLGHPQNTLQSNLISAEKMLFTEQYFDNIIVGSSLAYNMDRKQLDSTWFNLSFPGQSIFEGLSIIQAMEYKPKTIYIEINVLLRQGDLFFHHSLFNPITYPFKKHLSILKESQQPVSLIGDPIEYHIIRKLISEKEAPFDESISKEKLKNKLIQQMLKEHQQIHSNEIKSQIFELKRFIRELTDQRIRIVFFEMPVAKELCNSPKSKTIRNSIKKAFPEYMFIQQPSCGEFLTSDGIHLDQNSGTKFTTYFLKEIEELDTFKLKTFIPNVF